MERMSTSGSILAPLALVVVVAAIGLAVLMPALDEATLPAPEAQTTEEQEMEQAWENLVDAIQREDQVEALRLAEWLDEQQASKSNTAPIANLEIVKTWCALRGEVEGICKEEKNSDE